MSRMVIDGILQWFHDFRYRVSHRGRDQWSVLSSANEISILKNGRLCDLVPLSHLTRIRAVSRYMITRDEIFLKLETDDKNYWIGEYFLGFSSLSEQLRLAFPLRVADWYEELSKCKPFSNSEIILWEK